MKAIAAFASGLLFGVGLVVSGMTTPAKIVGFLDVFGAWDPALLFVMGGAVSIYALAIRVIRRRGKPVLASSFESPSNRDITPRLVVGAALFGVGWGLSGFCPGPAVVALATGAGAPQIFVVAMLVGMAVEKRIPE